MLMRYAHSLRSPLRSGSAALAGSLCRCAARRQLRRLATACGRIAGSAFPRAGVPGLSAPSGAARWAINGPPPGVRPRPPSRLGHGPKPQLLPRLARRAFVPPLFRRAFSPLRATTCGGAPSPPRCRSGGPLSPPLRGPAPASAPFGGPGPRPFPPALPLGLCAPLRAPWRSLGPSAFGPALAAVRAPSSVALPPRGLGPSAARAPAGSPLGRPLRGFGPGGSGHRGPLAAIGRLFPARPPVLFVLASACGRCAVALSLALRWSRGSPLRPSRPRRPRWGLRGSARPEWGACGPPCRSAARLPRSLARCCFRRSPFALGVLASKLPAKG